MTTLCPDPDSASVITPSTHFTVPCIPIFSLRPVVSIFAASSGTEPRGPICYCKCAINHMTAIQMNYLVSKRIPNAEAFLEHCERLAMKSRAVVFRQGDPSEDL